MLKPKEYLQRIKEKPRSVFDYIQGNLFYTFRTYLPEWYHEQVEYRKWMCDDCASLGYCITCKCKTPPKFYQWFPCSNQRWEAFKLGYFWYRSEERKLYLDE